MSGPLSIVLNQVEAGISSIAEMSRRTGLSPDVLRAAMDHLVRTGRVTTQALALGCPPQGCGGCAVKGCASSGTGRTSLTLLSRR
ncbi:MAG: FeoC-like transcriptional regulator [Propionicimonas sp.]